MQLKIRLAPVPTTPFTLRLGCSLLLFAVLLSSEALHGQSTSGTVLGTVKEASGGVVPRARVTLTNTGTNANVPPRPMAQADTSS